MPVVCYLYRVSVIVTTRIFRGGAGVVLALSCHSEQPLELLVPNLMLAYSFYVSRSLTTLTSYYNNLPIVMPIINIAIPI